MNRSSSNFYSRKNIQRKFNYGNEFNNIDKPNQYNNNVYKQQYINDNDYYGYN